MMRWLAALGCAGLLLAQQARGPVEAAWSLLAKGERAQAIRLLHDIIQANPADADARLLLGSVLMEEGEKAGSIAQLKEGVRLRPDSAEAQNALGEAYNNFDEPKPARGSFEKAIALDPNFAQAHVNLGLILIQAGEFAQAAGQLDRAIALLGDKPDAAYPRYLRAKVYTQQDQIAKAEQQLKKAVSLRPDFAEAWSDLGEARKTQLDDTGALADFKRAVELSPGDAVAQTRLGSEYLNQDQPQAAVPHLEEAVRLSPKDQSALYNLQLALREDGQTERAEAVKQKLTEMLRAKDRAAQNALTAIQLNNQGAALEKAGDLRGALEKYRAALDLDPEHVGIRVNVAAALLRLGQRSQGIAELREALRREPDNAAVKNALYDALGQTR